jgi:predicted transcriptional regulator
MSIIDRKSALSGLTVREAMRRLICYLDRNATIQRAIRHTIKYKLNAVLILDQKDEAIGVVSKTNILGAYYAGLPLTMPLDAIMAAPTITCHLTDSLDSALDMMRGARVQRLYVVGDEPNRVVGVLAYPDILGMLYRYCNQCERSTLRLMESGSTDKLADHFKVCELMSPAFHTHDENDSLIKIMESVAVHGSGTVLIKGHDDLPQGVVTITDLILAYLHDIPPGAAAKTIMSAPVLSCDYDEPLLMAVKKMIFSDLDSLYVHKDRPINIVGVVTLADVARLRSGSCRACMISRIELNN